MRLSEIGELSLVKTIRKKFSQKSKNILIGIGDDAAAIRCHGKYLLAATDMMVESVHFDLNFTSPFQLGFKLISVNASDIYAMGGTPQYALLDIAMNKNTEESFIKKFFDGIGAAAKLYGISLIGGDISSSKSGITVAASLIGYALKPVKRSGARPGDKIYVTGYLGDAACGLEILKRIRRPVPLGNNSERTTVRAGLPRPYKLLQLGLTWNMVRPLLKRHLMPLARNPKSLARHATAMIDISDGLFIDLLRLCDESKVGARIYVERIPVSPHMKKVSSALGLNSFNLATSGGEDYELLFTAPEASPIPALLRRGAGAVKITCIGEIAKRSRVVVDSDGEEQKLRACGYEHFTSTGAT